MNLLSKPRFPLAACAALLACTLSTPAPIVRADAVSDAKARVDGATTDLEKLNALFKYAQALNGFDATREELEKARDALNQSLAIIARMEAAGNRIQPQSHFHYMAGLVAERLDDYASAIRFFDAAERWNFVAENATARHKGALLFGVRGEAKWKNYDYTGALADFNRAIELNNDEKGYYSQRARLHFDMGNEDAARSDWAKGDKIASGEQVAVENAARQAALLDGTNNANVEFPFDRKLLPFNKAIAGSPRETQLLLNRAAYLVRTGFRNEGGNAQEIAKAQRDLSRVLRLAPRSAQAHHLQALALWRLTTLNRTLHDAKSDEAIQMAFGRALQNTDNPAPYRVDAGDYLVARARALILTDPGARPKVLVNAMFNYSHAVLKQPNNSLARARRIRLEMTSERPDPHTLLTDSEAIARDGLTASPETVDETEAEKLRAEAQTARAQALLQNGELTQAQQVLDAALQNDKSATNLRLRGQIHVLRGRYDEAITDLEDSLNHARGNSQTWWWLGLAQDGKGNTVRAKSALDNAIRIDARLSPQLNGTRYAASTPTAKALVMPPVTGELTPSGTALQHKDAGNALVQKQDEDGALAEYNVALRIDPNYADALNNRANIYHNRGKVDLALDDIKIALQNDPEHRVAWLTRSHIYYAMGDLKSALADLNNAVRYAETDERRCGALISRARLYVKMNDKARARDDIDAAQKLAGNEADRLKQIEEIRAALEK
jgi:tetratricopeptide (TPR) repeat protein